MIPNDQSIKHFPVEKLFLDPLNPRLGESAGVLRQYSFKLNIKVLNCNNIVLN